MIDLKNIASFLKKTASRKTSWRWALRTFYLLFTIALLANLLANDKPYVCQYKGQWYAPVFKEISVNVGLSQWPVEHINTKWYKLNLDWAVWPPVHYAADQSDRANRFKGPFDEQKVKNNWFRHWLGTDEQGQDVLAGLIWGTRIALMIGFGATLIAAFIGILLGALAGFLGDKGFYLRYSQILGLSIGLWAGLFLGFIVRQHLWSSNERLFFISGGLIWLTAILYACLFLSKKILTGQWWLNTITIPVDSLIMRLIETLNALPGLLLLLSIVAILPRPSILSVIIIIGLLSWTGIARFVRGELLRIRSLEYIEAAKTIGFSTQQILWRHALPNAMGPVYVALTFAVAAAIIIEASLSFLGIGMPQDIISWGGILSNARVAPEAWWLAVFPGIAISATVVTLFTLGEAFSAKK